MSRTGDTSQAERRQIQKNPPEILITTPESLNILVTSAGGQRLLGGLRTVILDEIHAVFGSKRGVHLMSAVERLVPLSGEFQRVALSATVHPKELIARWVGGHRIERTPSDRIHHPRTVTTIAATTPKAYDIGVSLPVAEPGASRDPDSLWAELTRRLKRTVREQPIHSDLRQQQAGGGEGGQIPQRGRADSARLLPPRSPVQGDQGGCGRATQGGPVEGHRGHQLPRAGYRHRCH